MDEVIAWLPDPLGLDRSELGIAHMIARGVVVYVVTIVMVRLSKKRFMSRATAFDVVLGIMLGSIVSRAITGNAPFFPALAAAAAVLAVHWLFSAVALRWHGFGHLIKGMPRVVIRDGVVDREQLRRAHMTAHDLEEDLRINGVRDASEVREARLERSGALSILK